MVLNKVYIVGYRFARFQDNLLKLQELRSSQIPREDINRYYYQVVKGLKVSELEKKAQTWFVTLPTNIFVLPSLCKAPQIRFRSMLCLW